MSSSRARLGDAVTPGLAGLGIAAAIAREAVDAVPVVKQVLGVVVRILALAEKIDKDRDTLHELVKKSVQLAERVKAVLGDRTGDEVFQPSIDRIRGVFEEIAEYMQKHVSRSRLSRAFGYAFTVKLHVDRLSRKLEDAVQELFMVAQITTTLAVNDGARFDGEFRLFRHCEVDQLDLIREYAYNRADRKAIVRYRRARVDGTPVVVRYFVGNVSDESCRETYESVQSCDRLLEELSTVQRSHRNVARFYGRSKGSIHDQFKVFKAGFFPVGDLIHEMPNPIVTILRCAFKLLDAADHLRRQGIRWMGGVNYMLDDHHEPTIGLNNDLCRADPKADPLVEGVDHVCDAIDPLGYPLSWQRLAATELQPVLADINNEQLTSLLGKFTKILRQRCVIPKANLLHGIVPTDGTAEHLLRVCEGAILLPAWRSASCVWADILLALDKSRNHRLRKGLRVIYNCYGPDEIRVHALAEDSERIVYDHYSLMLPDSQSDEVRAMFGIPAHSKGLRIQRRIVATGGPGTYCVPE